MRRECRERFPRHRLQKKPLGSDPGMHTGTCLRHVPWCMPGLLPSRGGKNIPGIPGACATSTCTYLARSPLISKYIPQTPMGCHHSSMSQTQVHKVDKRAPGYCRSEHGHGELSHWGRDKMADFLQKSFSNAFLQWNARISIEISLMFVP